MTINCKPFQLFHINWRPKAAGSIQGVRSDQLRQPRTNQGYSITVLGSHDNFAVYDPQQKITYIAINANPLQSSSQIFISLLLYI